MAPVHYERPPPDVRVGKVRTMMRRRIRDLDRTVVLALGGPGSISNWSRWQEALLRRRRRASD
jgi:hypothetical protein